MMRTLLALCCLLGCSALPPELPTPQQPLALTEEATFPARPPEPTLQTTLAALEVLDLESATLANGLTVWVAHRAAPHAQGGAAAQAGRRRGQDGVGPEAAERRGRG